MTTAARQPGIFNRKSSGLVTCAERADGDAGVERRRVELLVSEQPRAIMRTFYVTETQSSVG